MSVTLSTLPDSIFQSTNLCNRAVGYASSSYKITGLKKYIEIPIDQDEFEVPIFAMTKFIELVKNNLDTDFQVMAAELYSRNAPLRYVSVERYMRDVLLDIFSKNGLLKCPAKSKDGTVTYYATHGAVFNSFLEPVAMCSWQFKRYLCEDTTVKNTRPTYSFVRPIFRIDPSVYMSQNDAMEKFLIKRFSTALLSLCKVSTPLRKELPARIVTISEYKDLIAPSVRIEKIPFNINPISEPTIDTTNEELRRTALNYVEEIVP